MHQSDSAPRAAKVLRISTAGPDDVQGLAHAISAGLVRADSIVAVMAKTEGDAASFRLFGWRETSSTVRLGGSEIEFSRHFRHLQKKQRLFGGFCCCKPLMQTTNGRTCPNSPSSPYSTLLPAENRECSSTFSETNALRLSETTLRHSAHTYTIRLTQNLFLSIGGMLAGNGCVNDYTRGFATQSLALFLAGQLGLTEGAVKERVAFIMSGGTEGAITPHLLVFCIETSPLLSGACAHAVIFVRVRMWHCGITVI